MLEEPEVEILRGKEYPKVSPKRTHAIVQRSTMDVLRACGARERGEYLTEWRFRVGAVDDTPDSLLPDVAFFSNERLAMLTREESEEPAGAPDIAIEIRSPGQSLAFVADKLARYLETGATLALDIDPASRTLHAVDAAGRRSFRADETFEHASFPWLRFSVHALFDDLDRT